jgi:hypothetical protein
VQPLAARLYARRNATGRVRRFLSFRTSDHRRSRCSLCDKGGFVAQINHLITAGYGAEAVSGNNHREFCQQGCAMPEPMSNTCATKFTRYSIPVQVLDYSVSDGHTRNDPLPAKLKFHISSVVLAQLIEQFPLRCFYNRAVRPLTSAGIFDDPKKEANVQILTPNSMTLT